MYRGALVDIFFGMVMGVGTFFGFGFAYADRSIPYIPDEMSCDTTYRITYIFSVNA